MSKPRIDPEKTWYDQARQWIVDNGGGTKVANGITLDGLCSCVPMAARYPERHDGVTYSLSDVVPAKEVLASDSKQIRAGSLVGEKTMELLGRFLREHNAKLADGWDGS